MDKEEVVHIKNGILFSRKKDEMMPCAATWMDLEIIILCEARRRKTDTIWCHLYMESKVWHKLTYLQDSNRFTDIANRPVVARGYRGRDGLESGISRCRPLSIEWINNRILLCSTGNYIQHLVTNHNGKENEKEFICITESLPVQQKITQVVNQPYQKKKF